MHRTLAENNKSAYSRNQLSPFSYLLSLWKTTKSLQKEQLTPGHKPQNSLSEVKAGLHHKKCMSAPVCDLAEMFAWNAWGNHFHISTVLLVKNWSNLPPLRTIPGSFYTSLLLPSFSISGGIKFALCQDLWLLLVPSGSSGLVQIGNCRFFICPAFFFQLETDNSI